MEWESKAIRFGAAVIACAILLRLAGTVPEKLLRFLSSREAISTLVFLETGRVLQPPPTDTPEHTEALTSPVEATVPSYRPPSAEALPVFSPEDAALVEVNNVCGYDADVAECLSQSLNWDLTSPSPTVLIVHSHATESYENTENYEETAEYRTEDVEYNVVSVGDRLVQVLEAGGVHALHDRQLHDAPSYSASYANARESIQAYLEKYPTIRLVLDIHRDSVENGSGEQMAVSTQIQGKPAARLMMVVGTDASGLSHPGWPENMSLAVKLHAQLEKLSPGICRPISFRSQRFNQDLSPGALIVEVGAAGNTRQEALLAVELLGKAIIDLSRGTT